MNIQTQLEKEVAKSIKEEQAIHDRLHSKKEILLELKKLYSQKTDELYSSNQMLIRMNRALKQQSKDINKQTKNYIDNCVGIALSEAESNFYSETKAEYARNAEYVICRLILRDMGILTAWFSRNGNWQQWWSREID